MTVQTDGLQSYLTAPDSATLRLTDGSYSVWVNAQATASGSIMEKWSGSLSLVFLSGSIVAQLQDEAGTPASAPWPGLNAWHHVAATFDHTTTQLKLYVDDVLKSTKTGAWSITSTSQFYLGNGRNGFSSGTLAEACVYNRVLSASEVTTLAAGGKINSGLQAYWPLSEGSGTTPLDYSGNKNDLAFQGSPGPIWGTATASTLATRIPVIIGASGIPVTTAATPVVIPTSPVNTGGIPVTLKSTGLPIMDGR